jgi:hypothetical protein
VNLALRPPRSTDPPVLLTLPSLLKLSNTSAGPGTAGMRNVEEDAAV